MTFLIFVEKVFERLVTRIKGGGHYEVIANYFGYDLSEVRFRFQKSDGLPVRATIEAIIIRHPEITVKIFAKVVEQETRRSDVADLKRAHDLDLLKESV